MNEGVMNGYGLAAVIIQSIASLAWPGAFITIVWLFRKKVVELLPLLSLKHGDTEVSFRLEQAEKEAAALPPRPEANVDQIPTQEEQDRFSEIAKISPRAAILELRRDLEGAVMRLAEKHGVSKGEKTLPMLAAIRSLRNMNVIDSHTSAMLDDLRSVGNSAAHGSGEFREEDAVRYRKLANDVISRLDSR